jgi:hypothetical protein
MSNLPLLSFNPVNTSCEYNTALDIFDLSPLYYVRWVTLNFPRDTEEALNESRHTAVMFGLNHTLRVLKTLSPILYRMHSTLTCLRNPDKIFSGTTPSAPNWPEFTSSSRNWTTSSSLQWDERKGDDRRLYGVLFILQRTLRSVHKRKVSWPVEELTCSQYVPVLPIKYSKWFIVLSVAVSHQANTWWNYYGL